MVCGFRDYKERVYDPGLQQLECYGDGELDGGLSAGKLKNEKGSEDMKLTNGTMWDSIQVLTETQEKGKLGYACARNLRKLMDAAKEYMQTRDRLLKEFGDDQGNGKYGFAPDQAKAFSEALKEYSEIEHDVDVMTVSEQVFTSGNLTTKEMFRLSWMVEES